MTELRPPSDKSITHRAMILAAMSRSRVTIRNALICEDTLRTLGAITALGAETAIRGGDVIVEGRPWKAPGLIDCGNSGTTARLLLGAVAGHHLQVTFDGDDSLRRRPMLALVSLLRRMGADVKGEKLPITVRGGDLKGLNTLLPVPSAQVKSGVLLAGLASGVGVSLLEPVATRDHTERLLRYLPGVTIRSARMENAQAVILDAGVWPPKFFPSVHVPADPSAAAFLAAAALVQGREIRLTDVCLNPTRTGFFDALLRMGAKIHTVRAREIGGELVGDLIVLKSPPLQAVEVDFEEVPRMIDEIPVLAALAMTAHGTSWFYGLGELRKKESDRVDAILQNLRGLGVKAQEKLDVLTVPGKGRAPSSGRIDTRGDHRILMAFAAVSPWLSFSETRSNAISYPDYWRDLEAIRG